MTRFCTLLFAMAFGPMLTHAMTDLEEMESKVDAVAIWQGFEFTWQDEPHRAGRFGNWITQNRTNNEVHVSLNQSAASGTSEDTGIYTAHYALMASPNLKSLAGSTQFQLVGSQLINTAPVGGLEPDDVRLHTFARTIDVEIEPMTTGELHAVALLSGFDLQRNVPDAAIPQKLSVLDINLSAPVMTSSSTLQFVITGELRMSCRSGECNKSGDVNYSLTIPYVILHGPQQTFYSEALAPIVSNATHSSGSTQTGTENINTQINLQTPALAQDLANRTIGMSGIRLEATKPTNIWIPDPTPHLKTWELYLHQSGNNIIGNHYFNDGNSISNLGHNVTMEIISRPVALHADFAWITQCQWHDETDFAAEMGNQSGGITHNTSAGRIEPLYYLLNGKTWAGEIETTIHSPLGPMTLVTTATDCLANESRFK